MLFLVRSTMTNFDQIYDSRYSRYDPRDTQNQIRELLESIPDEVDDCALTEGTPSEMTISLMRHQTQGLNWMKDREEGEKKNGGILADVFTSFYVLFSPQFVMRLTEIIILYLLTTEIIGCE